MLIDFGNQICEHTYLRYSIFLALLLLIQACKHPLAIVGEGDIVDLNGSGYGCSLEQFKSSDPACAGFDFIDDYIVNYEAVPRDGWLFVRWEGPCKPDSSPPNCSLTAPLNFSTAMDDLFPAVLMPTTTAVFEQIDSDGDGVGDFDDPFPLNAIESADTDGDGVGDFADPFPLDASRKALKPLNDTGLTWGADSPSGNNDTCIGEVIEQQDCSNGRDSSHNDNSDGHAGFSYTKLDASGVVLALSDTSWSCVRDNVTGLIWEVKTDDGGVHDKNISYRWGGKTAVEGDVGEYFSDWDTLVDTSNVDALCGFEDWRVPTVHELMSLRILNAPSPTIDTNFFPNARSVPYWSANTFPDGPTKALIFYFSTGDWNTFGRDRGVPVRLVRGHQ
jgi:hypothetical protein